MNSKPLLAALFLIIATTACADQRLPEIQIQVRIMQANKIIHESKHEAIFNHPVIISSAPFITQVTVHKGQNSEMHVKAQVRKGNDSWGEGKAITTIDRAAKFDFYYHSDQLNLEVIPIKVVRK